VEWVPYIIVIGDKEIKSSKINVRVRSIGKQKETTLKQLTEEIHKLTEGKPYRKLPLTKELSKRPSFTG